MRMKRFFSLLLCTYIAFMLIPAITNTAYAATTSLCGGWSTVGSTAKGNVYYPGSIAVNSSRSGAYNGLDSRDVNVYVADSELILGIKKLSNGTWTKISGSTFNINDKPIGVAVDGEDNVYALCSGVRTTEAVWKYNGSTWTDITYGNQFQGPRGITVDSGGDIFVLNMHGGVPNIDVLWYGRTTWVSADISISSAPNIIAISVPYADANAQVYLLDSAGHVYEGSVGYMYPTLSFLDWKQVATAPGGSGSGLTTFPTDTSGKKCNLYVTDASNKCVDVLTYDNGYGGPWTTLQYGASNAFNSPADIAVDYNGKMYVADAYVNDSSTCVSKITEHQAVPSKLVWITQPGDGTSTKFLSQQPKLALEDANGNVETDDSEDQVTLSLSSSTGSLVGTATATLSNGYATFTDFGVTGPGSYTLAATCSGITSASSESFTIANITDLDQSGLYQSSDTVEANGSDYAIITVYLLDANGNPVVGREVKLNKYYGNPTITAINSTSDTNGKATFKVTDTVAESTGYNFTDITDNLTQNVVIDITFTDTTPPTVSSVSPNSTTAALSGNIVITFNEAMKTSSGSVALNGTALTGGTWSSGNTVYTIPYSSLSYSTKYTVAVSGFQDAAGNTMTADSSNNFTTMAEAPPADYIIKAMAGAGGGINPSGSTSVPSGNSITYTATAEKGYQIEDVLIDGLSVGAIDTYTFKDVKETHTISVSFEKSKTINPFNDVKTGDWFYSNVMYVYENSLMIGTSANTFTPNGSITRAMAITVLYRMSGDTENYDRSFTDIPSGAWYENAVNWAAKKGIVNGVGNNQFAAEKEVTREQFAVMLYHYAEYKGYNVVNDTDTKIQTYKDASNISDYAYSAMEWACSKKILLGDNSGLLNPQGHSTRAETAAMIERFIENVAS